MRFQLVTKSLFPHPFVLRVAPLPSGLPLLQHLQVHAERLLDGLLGDEVDKVLDVSLPAGQQPVDGGLPHHGLGDLPGVVWRRSKRMEIQFADRKAIVKIVVTLKTQDALKTNAIANTAQNFYFPFFFS